MNEELKTRINNDKEILSVLPQNNLRNRKKYRAKLEELLGFYTNIQEHIFCNIKERNSILNSDVENKDLERIKKSYQSIYDVLYLFNEYNTSYEKLNIDRMLYGLSMVYKTTLDKVNTYIANIINTYQQVGLKITKDEFNFSRYLNEYMDTFIIELNKGNCNSDVVIKKFEEVYWKCPSILTHLVVNFKYLYYKNQKLIDKNLKKKQIDCLKKTNSSYEKLVENYKSLIIKYDKLESIDKYTIKELFASKELKIEDYTSEKIEKLGSQFLLDQTLTLDDIYPYIKELSKALNEYKVYCDYSFIIDDIKRIYSEKEQYKNVRKNEFKDINKKQLNILKLNKKLRKLLVKNTSFEEMESINNIINDEIISLNTLYDKLDKDIFYEKVGLVINNTSSIIDVLYLASSYYNYIVSLIKNRYSDKVLDDINLMIDEIKKYVKNPYNIIMDNIYINDINNLDGKKDKKGVTEDDIQNVNIAKVICDKYSLVNVNLIESNLENNSINGIIDIVNSIIMYNNIKESGLTYSDILFICKSNELLEIKK